MLHHAVRFGGFSRPCLLGVAAVVGLGVATPIPVRQALIHAQARSVREFSLTAHRYTFTPERIEVKQGDIVKLSILADDIPHSFTIDAYRISKRASPGQAVIIEFRADQIGTHPFYCSLTAEDGCRQMRGELIVR